MGFRFRKSKNFGPFRVNASKSGIGWSVGTKGVRYTKRADGKTQTTLNIPGTGISYVDVKGKSNNNNSTSDININLGYNSNNNSSNNKPPFFKRQWFMWLMLIFVPPIGLILMWLYSGYKKLPKIVLSLFFVMYSFALYGQNNTNKANQSITNNQAEIALSDSSDDSTNSKSDDNTVSTQAPESQKLTGWQTINNKTYYYDDNGTPKSGWIKDNDNYYYCNDSGEMNTGWIKDNGNWYFLYPDGTMATNISKDGYTIDANGLATKDAVTTSSNSNSSNASSNSVQSSNTKEKTVYVASSGKGKKYHSTPNCSKMKGTITMTVSEAENNGYTPCSKCH